jgi:hypothetical protein
MAALDKLVVIQVMQHDKPQHHSKALLLQMKLFCKVQTNQNLTILVKVMPNLVPADVHLLAVALLVKRWMFLEQQQARTGPVQHLMAQRQKETIPRDLVPVLSFLKTLSKHTAAPSVNVQRLRYCCVLNILNSKLLWY